MRDIVKQKRPEQYTVISRLVNWRRCVFDWSCYLYGRATEHDSDDQLMKHREPRAMLFAIYRQTDRQEIDTLFIAGENRK